MNKNETGTDIERSTGRAVITASLIVLLILIAGGGFWLYKRAEAKRAVKNKQQTAHAAVPKSDSDVIDADYTVIDDKKADSSDKQLAASSGGATAVGGQPSVQPQPSAPAGAAEITDTNKDA